MGRSLGVVLLLVAFVAGVVGVIRSQPLPARAVDIEGAVAVARDAAPFDVLVPAAVPDAWQPTNAQFEPGPPARWRLGWLTPDDYVAVVQHELPVAEVLPTLLDDPVAAAEPVVVDGEQWTRWEEGPSGNGDVALTREAPDVASVVVFGSADYSVVEDVAASLG
jgi:hypothetical protein